ncbi:MAG TPA: DNA-binding response regulator [Cryomorphaceae bacterium]|nr:DNA-binding response regulator [Owenweeksia sp.]MBG00398.1 DNA-binding response regulator [Owenweeksia sp.]HAD96527.1 DNA-binding response regulator [Cryomorphaceae bacterium]HBF21364.1 DNA-binding response regulator [Cryomorphaceae bacterium]|tara:strand:- start:1217 stop:1945 length:729 start_codon:yes stop_codon:yes gene_type:complete
MSTDETQILIVEDEALIAHDISFTLKNAGYSISGIAHSANDAISMMKKAPPALALLDIHIKGSIDGLMLANIINQEFNIPFIFLTSYTDDKTLARVKELKAAGFIVKPFDAKELCTNIELAIERYKSEKATPTDWGNVDNNYFFVKRSNSLIKLCVDDILYAQAFDNYCNVITKEEKYLITHTLKSVEEKLEKYNFFRIHRSFLVNLPAIEVISEDNVMIGDVSIPIGRSAKADLMQRISLL